MFYAILSYTHFYVTFLWQLGPEVAPTGFAVASVDGTSLTLTWHELSCSDHNGAILGYVIRYTADGATAFTTELTFGSNQAQLTGLVSCTIYTFTVAAQNDEGIGVFSSPLSVFTSRSGKA